MSTVGEVRTALGSTIRAAIPELNVYNKVPDVTQVPAVVIRPGKCDYVVGGGACQDWAYELYVLVARTDTVIKQDQLDEYISATGANSVVAAIRATPGLGLSDVDAVVTEMKSYGGSWDAARISHLGAQLNLRIIVTD